MFGGVLAIAEFLYSNSSFTFIYILLKPVFFFFLGVHGQMSVIAPREWTESASVGCLSARLVTEVGNSWAGHANERSDTSAASDFGKPLGHSSSRSNSFIASPGHLRVSKVTMMPHVEPNFIAQSLHGDKLMSRRGWDHAVMSDRRALLERRRSALECQADDVWLEEDSE